ncbi:MAG: fasciclin domain-containing protein [Myxococcota bacterium]
MTRALQVVFFVTGLLACSGDDEMPEDTGMPDMETETDTGDPPPPPPPPQNIVELAQDNDALSTLVSLLERVDLDDTLSGEGPFTVFAPVNSAFMGIDPSMLSDEELTEILSYHVVSGEVDSASIPERATSEATFTLFFDTDGGVRVNDANVTEADIDATNGIVHVIDSVLMPPNIVEAAGFAGLTELTAAVGAADPLVAATLSAPGNLTVFAPTDTAFQGITAPSDPEDLAEILTYHVLPTAVNSTEIPALATSFAGFTLFFDTSAGVMVNDATVVVADVQTTNGVVHVIDQVLLPPDILTAAGFAGLNELATAVGAANASVANTLSGPGPFTVFAPTDMAFQNITAPTDPDELAEILFYHALTEEVDSTTIPDLADSAAGFTMFFDTTAGVMVNDATVVVADVRTTNGIVHVIDTVLTPPDILDAAGFAGLNELATAVGAADPSVLKTLDGRGPFTVFAPTDAAFQSIKAPTDPAALAEILFYHALTSEVDSTAIPDIADSAAGFTLFFDTTAGVQVNQANVVIADVRTTNGIVHVIDDVLLPPDIATAAGFAGLNELVNAALAADPIVLKTLAGPGPFTVFAPTDAAFQSITAPTDPAALAEILFYHALTSEVDSTAIPALADSAAGFTLFFDTTAGVQVNQASVVIADVRTTNGIVHVIDDVLLPPDIVEAAGFAGLNELAAAVGAADASVVAALQGPGPLTVFAPTDTAFQAITAPTDPGELADILFYHAYPGSFDAASIPAKADSAFANDFGIPVSALFDTSNGVDINNASVVVADVRTTNGIVHVIDEVLLPPSILDLAGIAGLNSLAGALMAAPGDLDVLLSGSGPFTVFAPTDDAFSGAPAVTGQDLTDVLLFHVVDLDIATPVLAADLVDGEVDTALTETNAIDTITVDTVAGTVEGANLVLTDVNGTNGTVHVIDAVMIPPSF